MSRVCCSMFPQKPFIVSVLLRGVVTPVHQAVAPTRRVDIVLALRRVPAHITIHLAHMRIIVIGQAIRRFTVDTGDVPAAGVTDAFAGALAVRTLPADRYAVLRPQPFFDLCDGHVHRLIEVLADLVAIQLSHAPEMDEPTAKFTRTLGQVPGLS